MVEYAVVPHEQRHLVIVGTSLRKPPSILSAYLKSLAWQVLPRNVDLAYLFVDDGLDAEAKAVVESFLEGKQGQLIPSGQGGAPDFSDTHPETHQWATTAMERVGRNKDWILKAAHEARAQAVWFCDSDLICDPMTLMDLWHLAGKPEAQQSIACAVYWTRWQKVPPEVNPVHAGPQVWMAHPYGLTGGGIDEWELREKLVNRQIVPVFGQGACTMIREDAVRRGVSFAPVPGNTGPGLMQGEDRHFCIRAELLHLRMVASGWSDIFHIYHRPEDEALIPEMQQRLSLTYEGVKTAGQPARKEIGDLVSLELQALEPIPTQTGPMYPPIQMVRGRLGKVGLHPELEQALLTMTRGETRIVPVHFPLSYPLPPYRGQRKLIRVTLIDHKPFGFQPVIEQEIITNDIGSWVDTITLTPELADAMKEVHG